MRSFFLFLFCWSGLVCFAQSEAQSIPTTPLRWRNHTIYYFCGLPAVDSPYLIAAVPQNGILENTLTEGSGVSFNTDILPGDPVPFYYSCVAKRMAMVEVSDSDVIYLFMPGVYRSNADKFEYRIVRDSTREVQSWAKVESFSDKFPGINDFTVGMGMQGGFHAERGHTLTLELRRKGVPALLSSVTIRWQSEKPVLKTVITPDELAGQLAVRKGTFNVADDWAVLPGPTAGQRQLAAGTHALLFMIYKNVFRKEALEYSLSGDGRIIRVWGPNDHDNNTILLKGLGPGDYVFRVRFSRQREVITEYPFSIPAAWYEGWKLRWIIACVCLLALGVLGLMLSLRRQRRRTAAEKTRRERQSLELRSLHAQLNPHFIFNALSSIQGLVNRQDIENTNRYLSEFGSLVRQYLTEGQRESAPLQRELRMLETYLSLEQLRFKFQYEIHLAEDVPVGEIEVPSLLLQPLVENAVKHGIAGQGERGRIDLWVRREDTDLHVEVNDHGVGFDMGREYAGFGLRLTRERIRLLNQMEDGRRIELCAGAVPGTVVVLFKNWLS